MSGKNGVISKIIYNYQNLIDSLKKEIAAIDVPHKQKLHFTISLMCICALGLIAIEQLIKIQGDNEKQPPLHTLTRKELIIDMEKKTNLWQWIKTVYKLARG
jgi:hypothetical protein